FINRVSSDFHLLSPLKTLFCSLVRPILEYGSVLWDLSTASARSMIKRVQRKFLRQAAYKLKIVCPPHDYTPIQRLYSLESLTDRRHSANLTFLFNLLSSKIDSPELLSRVSFNVPSRLTRSSVPFHIPFSSSNYFLNSPIIRLMRIANTDPSFSF
ncbi:putative RNA-directed DNA polymerase, partial [Aphis craccivora]